MNASLFDSIRAERQSLKLIDRSVVTQILERKIEAIQGHVPALVYQIAVKALSDIRACQNQDQLYRCIEQWSNQANEQHNEELKALMASIGSILMRLSI